MVKKRLPEKLVLALEDEAPKTDMRFGCYHQSDNGTCKYTQDCQLPEQALDGEADQEQEVNENE